MDIRERKYGINLKNHVRQICKYLVKMVYSWQEKVSLSIKTQHNRFTSDLKLYELKNKP